MFDNQIRLKNTVSRYLKEKYIDVFEEQFYFNKLIKNLVYH